jgi:polysaccharide deacetylase family protein (PEP-CTERM system associated)
MLRRNNESGMRRHRVEETGGYRFPPEGDTRAGCILSVDVEDWFHILDVSGPTAENWDGLPSRIERNFLYLLDLFGETAVHATCFFLGWVARRFPALVRRAERAGHEIASHGDAHRLIYQMTPGEFFKDAVKSRKILEDISGREVLGYRAAGFSVTAATPWFFDKLIEAGYRYDSSIFPAARNHGGMPGACQVPYDVTTGSGKLLEFPATVTSVWGQPLCFFGGGYLRLSPLFLIKRMARRVLRQNRPVIFYLHPREIDPGHPRLPMSLRRRFTSYVRLESTEPKLRNLLATFPVTSFREMMLQNPAWAEVAGLPKAQKATEAHAAKAASQSAG